MYLLEGKDLLSAKEVDQIHLAKGAAAYFGSQDVFATDFALPELHFKFKKEYQFYCFTCSGLLPCLGGSGILIADVCRGLPGHSVPSSTRKSRLTLPIIMTSSIISSSLAPSLPSPWPSHARKPPPPAPLPRSLVKSQHQQTPLNGRNPPKQQSSPSSTPQSSAPTYSRRCQTTWEY